MSKTFISLVFITVFTLSLVLMDSVNGKDRRVLRVKANSCVDIWMTLHGTGPDLEWWVFAGNKCKTPEVVGKRIKIVASKNVTVVPGDVINLKRFIVPAQSKKLIFMASKSVPAERGRLWWRLIN